jgi:Domain of unknown function (DUF4159)
MSSNWKMRLLLTTAALAANACVAQHGGGGQHWGGHPGEDGPIYYTELPNSVPVDSRTVRTAREIATHSTDAPEWTNTPGFEKDVFTFARIIRDRDPYSAPRAGPWVVDFPDSDLNFSFRLQQVTTIRTDPDGRTIRLTDPDLLNYPWIYMVEPGGLLLREEEVPILRQYLLNGGVLWADDFWGEWQWKVFERQMKRVFPDRDFVDVPTDHPLFHSVFDLNVPLNQLQTPAMGFALQRKGTGVTWEVHPREDGSMEQCVEMHVRAIFDDKGNIMVLATHNCDNGDSWEREGADDWFFHEFSEKRGYPLGINAIVYFMTH